MKTTHLSDFRKELLATGAYRTHEDCKAPKRAKPSAYATFTLSWNTVRVFPLCALYEPLGKLTTDLWAHICFSTVQGAERLGMNVVLEGWNNRAAYSGPVMYLCNHYSSLETILLPPVLLSYGPFNVVTKLSLAHLPLLEKAAAHMGVVGITRKSPREDLMTLMKASKEKMGAGNSFLIFPQGTRQEVFHRNHFSSIGAKLAERAGCPICPIAVDSRCMPTRKAGLLKRVFKDFGPVDTSRDIKCCCGPLIPPGKAREMHEQSFDWIAGKLEEWGMGVDRC